MEIVVKRAIRTAKSTIGNFAIIGNSFTCYTLEDQDRGLTSKTPLDEIEKIKVYGQTAIPSGRYQVIINMSQRFGREMPLLLNVPGWAGVRIHVGNTDADTDGCILLGKSYTTDFVENSREAFTEFYPILKQALDNNETVFITLV